MLLLLDVLFTLLHIIIILFNLFGWIFPITRKAHFVCILLTAISWFVLGIWYGWGYCFITDWQWDIKRRLGETGLPNSFTAYMANKLWGDAITTETIDILTVTGFVLALVLSIYFNFIRPRRNV